MALLIATLVSLAALFLPLCSAFSPSMLHPHISPAPPVIVPRTSVLSSDRRRLIVHHLIAGRGFREVAGLACCCENTVRNIWKAYQEAGDACFDAAGHTGVPWASKKFDETVLRVLGDLILEDETAYLGELVDRLHARFSNLHFTEQQVYRALRQLGFVNNKVNKRATEADPVLRAQHREFCKASMWAHQAVFIDEVSSDLRDTQRQYAWVRKGERSSSSQYFVRGQRYTTIGAISCHGMLAARTVLGAATAQDFMDFLVFDLAPKLNRWPGVNSTLVMDNGSIHKDAAIVEFIKAKGWAHRFLPPYSPDYNPIEKAWSKYKLWLKNNRALVEGAHANVRELIMQGLCSITPQDCQHWIEALPFLRSSW